MENREHLEQAAATWIARRDLGPWTADDAAGLQSWLAKSAGHRAAFYRLNAAWNEAGRLQILNTRTTSVYPNPQPLVSETPDTVEEVLKSRQTVDRPPLAQRLRGKRLVFKSAIAIAATVLIHLGVALVWLHGQHPDRNRYTTAVGELQSIPMPDGSRVTLNTDSRLKVFLKRSERRIDLDYGEAFFEVAKDPKRPFFVVAGNRTIIAIGTQFSVRRDGDDVHVVVSEGTVGTEFSKRANERDRRPQTLLPENKALWTAGSVAHVRGDSVQVDKESIAEINEKLSWRMGRLTFRDTPLASAIVEFNRYNTRKLVIQDPAMAAVRISGVFASTQLAPFIHLLEQRFPIHATVEDDRILLSTSCSSGALLLDRLPERQPPIVFCYVTRNRLNLLFCLGAMAAAANAEPAMLTPSDSIPFTHEEQALLARRKETDIGPRITSEQVCGTARQLNDTAQQTQNALREGIATSFRPPAPASHAAHAKSGTDSTLCSRGEPALAIESCTRIIDDPRSLPDHREIALRNRGWLLQSQGDLDRAIQDYNAVLKLTLDVQHEDVREETRLNARTHVNRGLAYANKGDDERASTDYDQALRLDPTASSAYLNRAALYSRRGEEERALSDLDEALKLDRKNASAHVSRGTIHLHRGDAERAIADFSAAIELNPRDAIAWRARGFAYRAQGDNARAASDAQEAIRLDPNMAAAHQDLALTFQARGDTRSATAELDKAVELSPHDAKAMLTRGDSYLAHGERDHAIADYSQAIALDPKLSTAYINRGVAYMSQHDWDRAIADFTTVIGLGTSYRLPAYIDRGQALEAKGEQDAAMSDFEQAIRLDPDSMEALRHRAFLRHTKGDFPGAAADYGHVIALAPNDAEARRGRGYAELSQHHYDAAITDLTAAIRLNPNDAVAYRYRSLAYAGNHDTQRAKSDDQASQLLDSKRR